MQMAIFAIWSRASLKKSSIEAFFEHASEFGLLGASSLIKVIFIIAKRPNLHSLAGEKAVAALSLINQETEVNQRGGFLSELARAILPASASEAATYFRQGIEQMDAIGAGDYTYASQLLEFASTAKGAELEARDFHTLANIAELNLWDEPGKFDWGNYGKALAVTAGARVLTKISRLADIGQAALEYSLLPCLTGLVQSRKLDPAFALSLNRLADPAELYVCNTEAFAKAIYEYGGDKRRRHVAEVIEQYRQNSNDHFSSSAVKALQAIAADTFGKSSSEAIALEGLASHMESVSQQRNDHRNLRNGLNDQSAGDRDEERRQVLEQVQEITSRTTPSDPESLGKALQEYFALERAWDTKASFFTGLRERVAYSERGKYVELVASHDNLDLHHKLNVLTECKSAWASSSASIVEAIRDAAYRLIKMHAGELIGFDRINGWQIVQIGELSGASHAEIAIDLVKAFSEPDENVSGAIWLALAGYIAPSASDGVCQGALTKLLRSETAQLSSSAQDGPWRADLYPNNDPVEISAGLVWCMLGSPEAEHRWRAAHSIRSFARFECWNVLDSIVSRLNATDAGPFQVPQHKFFYLNARLWLLIALARIAKDFPEQIARYKSQLLECALPPQLPHVLMQHFASTALKLLLDAGAISLSGAEVAELKSVNTSRFPAAEERVSGRDDSYSTRSKEYKEPEREFYFDYDFKKVEVDRLGRLFGEHTWAVCNLITDIAIGFDPGIRSMCDHGGRGDRARSYREEGKSQTYGEYLAWHSLFIAAGTLLKTTPVHKSWSDDERPWDHWLASYRLTREDGYWLSDGTDQMPPRLIQNLLEESSGELALTGDETKLVDLIVDGLDAGDSLVIDGSWDSYDGIHVNVSCALFKPSLVAGAVKRLLKTDPFQIWLPYYEEDPITRLKDTDGKPLVLAYDSSLGLDETDSYGVSYAAARRRICDEYVVSLGLSPLDAMETVWVDAQGNIGTKSEVWGSNYSSGEGSPGKGQRLLISFDTLSTLLHKTQLELVVLIRLRRYEKGWGGEKSKYTHTVGIVNIDEMLKRDFSLGCVNLVHKSEW